MSDEGEIRRIVEDFVDAFNAGEMARILQIITEDFIDMSAGGPTRKGQAAREHFLSRVTEIHAKFRPSLVVNIEEMAVTANWAYQRGNLVMTLEPRGAGESSVVRQRYLEIWRRCGDGKWRIAIEMDNSEEP